MATAIELRTIKDLAISEPGTRSISAAVSLRVGGFDPSEHARHHRYRKAKVGLTKLGQAVVEAEDDFSRYNRIHRWWGGTELTNERLWRWDRETRLLVAPA